MSKTYSLAEDQQLLWDTIRRLITLPDNIEASWYGLVIDQLRLRAVNAPILEVDGHTIPLVTAAVSPDGDFIFNPNFLRLLNPQERMGITIHELLHVILRHPEEMQCVSNPKKYNIAADLCVNSFITSVSAHEYTQLPKIAPYLFRFGGLTNQQKIDQLNGKKIDLTDDQKETLKNHFCGFHPLDWNLPVGLSAMHYYRMLPDKITETMPTITVATVGDCRGNHKIEHQWEMGKNSEEFSDEMQAVCNRAMNKRDRGEIPACVTEAIDQTEQKNTKLDFKKHASYYIRTFLSPTRKVSFKRPDRRFGIFPSKKKLRKSNVVVAFDTSGSTHQDRALFLELLIQVRDQLKVDIHIIECDARVGASYPFNGTAPTEMTGGGGTAFGPVFKYVKKHKIPCNLLIFMTDGWGEYPDKPPFVNYPVLWVTTDKKPAPWGKAITTKGKVLP